MRGRLGGRERSTSSRQSDGLTTAEFFTTTHRIVAQVQTGSRLLRLESSDGGIMEPPVGNDGRDG